MFLNIQTYLVLSIVLCIFILMSKRFDLKIGQRFGRIVVLEELEPIRYDKRHVQRRVTGKCDCGSIKEYFLDNLKFKTTVSCGCHRLESFIKWRNGKN